MPKQPLSPEVANRIPMILEGFKDGKTLRQVAKENDLTENQIYWVMRNDHARDLIFAKLREVEDTYMTKVYEMLDSESKVDQRAAMQELGKINKQFTDKVYPTLTHSRNETLTANVDNVNRQRWEYVLKNLPPDVRGAVVDKYKEACEEYPLPG